MRSESLVEMPVGAAGIPAITPPSLLISVAGRAERVKAMGRAFICLGALTAALLAAAPEARAKMVYYEINGQRYSYSTNNRAQVKEARQRIDAANAAEAAKAKAQAERSANPLVAVFGSKVQSDAKEAEARAQQALSGQARAEPAAGPVPEAAATRHRGRTEAAQAKAHPGRTARARAARHPAPAVKVASRSSRKPASEVSAKPAVASVFYDAESGIKTMQMTDGTVREEPFDPSSTPEGRAIPDATGTLQKPPAKGQ
jgi:hypothetical protein